MPHQPPAANVLKIKTAETANKKTLSVKANDAVVHINMYGNNSSMNVAQATSIALYEFTKQLNS